MYLCLCLCVKFLLLGNYDIWYLGSGASKSHASCTRCSYLQPQHLRGWGQSKVQGSLGYRVSSCLTTQKKKITLTSLCVCRRKFSVKESEATKPLCLKTGRMLKWCLSDCSMGVMKHHDQATYRRKHSIRAYSSRDSGAQLITEHSNRQTGEALELTAKNLHLDQQTGYRECSGHGRGIFEALKLTPVTHLFQQDHAF